MEQKRQKFEFEPFRANGLLNKPSSWCGPWPKSATSRSNSCRRPRIPPSGATAKPSSQILSNLLDNAIKYTPAGGRIAVGAEPRGRLWSYIVHDTGIGIPPEELPRLFERFYRVDKARSRELGGTGLGLSIVKHLVAAHNGTTRVESRPGEGSTFFFTLPVDESALSQSSLIQNSLPLNESVTRPLVV